MPKWRGEGVFRPQCHPIAAEAVSRVGHAKYLVTGGRLRLPEGLITPEVGDFVPGGGDLQNLRMVVDGKVVSHSGGHNPRSASLLVPVPDWSSGRFHRHTWG